MANYTPFSVMTRVVPKLKKWFGREPRINVAVFKLYYIQFVYFEGQAKA